MAKRVPASMRPRQSLRRDRGTAVVAGGTRGAGQTGNAADHRKTLEAEARDAVGRGYYEHGAEPGSGYRNGYRSGRLKTAEGVMYRPRLVRHRVEGYAALAAG
jgi:hypothetical protein